jgi:arylsulfatase A-like enzyme
VLDDKVGRVLRRLEEEKLAGNTVVIFFGDNGRCHIRDKQFLYDGGIHVPLIIRAPGLTKAGTVSDELISGIDLPAVSLALAGIDLPPHMQGQAFLGPKAGRPRDYIFAHRDRCDETTDRIRCVRDKRYKYIRNFMPDRPYMQANKYKEQSYPAWNLMKELKAQGKLTAAQAAFTADRRPEEELYDIQSDPHELKNLAGAEAHRDVLTKMRGELEQCDENGQKALRGLSRRLRDGRDFGGGLS